ncbi:hypothetical protein ACFPLB_11585 [Aquamicrobium segne]|uniref:Tetratricopeptide repeat protein n=1 Tax=Aquamicrobium segne TaxID=469547 RepID=A0ABW0GY61_9HYPH
MRFIVFTSAVFLSLSAMVLAAAAQELPHDAISVDVAVDAAIERPIESRAQKLDRLFFELKREGNARAGERIARRIQQEWSQSGSATVDLMMDWAQKAISAQNHAVALDFLDQIVTLQPEFAEGWNRRATLHYAMKNYAKSMADIDRTFRLEPRHYGAISGLARIMSDTGREAQALKAWQHVLDIYPALLSAQEQLASLAEKLAGQSI